MTAAAGRGGAAAVSGGFISVAEAAEFLGVSRPFLYELLRRRENGQPVVPHVRLGRRVLLPRPWLEELAAGAGVRLAAAREHCPASPAGAALTGCRPAHAGERDKGGSR